MAGTIEGGRKAAKTNIEKYGKDFYRIQGRKGGRNGHTGGFASDKVGKDGLTGLERAALAGRKGGKLSKRGPSKQPRTANKKTEEAKKERGGWKWLFSGKRNG